MRWMMMAAAVAALAACESPVAPVTAEPEAPVDTVTPPVAVPAYAIGEQTDLGLVCEFRPVFDPQLLWYRGHIVVPEMGLGWAYDPLQMRDNSHLTVRLTFVARQTFRVVWEFMHAEGTLVGTFTCVAPAAA